MSEVKGSFQAAFHIFNKRVSPNSNTTRLIYIAIHGGAVAHYNAITCIRASLTDRNRICAFSTIIIVVSAIGSRIYLEVMNFISIYLSGQISNVCCISGYHSIDRIQLCHVHRIGICRACCYPCNLTSNFVGCIAYGNSPCCGCPSCTGFICIRNRGSGWNGSYNTFRYAGYGIRTQSYAIRGRCIGIMTENGSIRYGSFRFLIS